LCTLFWLFFNKFSAGALAPPVSKKKIQASGEHTQARNDHSTQHAKLDMYFAWINPGIF
jgi:hypothetical protein